MSCLIPLLLLALLVAVCSLHEAGGDARTPAEVLAAARRAGVLRSLGSVGLALAVVVLLIASAIPLSVATQLANAGGLR
ncbi:hypothetical protein [Microbispora triticiradicis]|uniref:hypothetical protein n=1 Tax=Microbispora triticiradicis TaxID=2200763 RepID=UPI001AD770E2|nr:hypothetical protein [Microbispora triticiradicis]MBO4275168.1 hypothetical protein [Microbispora triticiradicis]